MWYHVWYHTVISQLCDIIVQNLWYHMWNHRLQRNTSCVISHSFFHITPWYHIWYHSMISHVSIWHHIWHHICDITYDITHDITISVISHMISHPGRQLKRLPPRRRRQVGVQEDQPLPRRRSPSSWSRHHRPPPRHRRRPRPLLVSSLDGVGCVRGGGGGLAFSNWPACLHCCCTAAQYSAQPPILLHSRQQPAWNAQDEADNVQISLQKRNGPDKPDQRQPKNRISVHQYCPMKKLNWFKAFNLSRTWRWMCLLKLWFDEANCDVQRIIGSAETSWKWISFRRYYSMKNRTDSKQLPQSNVEVIVL